MRGVDYDTFLVVIKEMGYKVIFNEVFSSDSDMYYLLFLGEMLKF